MEVVETDSVRRLGYSLERLDEGNDMFVLLFFRKNGAAVSVPPSRISAPASSAAPVLAAAPASATAPQGSSNLPLSRAAKKKRRRPSRAEARAAMSGGGGIVAATSTVAAAPSAAASFSVGPPQLKP